jgi:5'-nucleotidase
MKQSRREFIRTVTGAGALFGLGTLTSAFRNLEKSPENVKIVILHTNDVHSHLEPFPMNDPKFAGLGGVERRAAMIKKIRSEEQHVIVLDAGDIFQGTPYFNMYGGEAEIKLMSAMGYDASAIGNHDFDGGLDNLAKQLQHATFPLLCANYDFTGTPMEGKTQPYKIFTMDGVKVGVFGLGIEMAGLIDSRLYGKTVYQDPLIKSAEMVNELRDRQKCDVVICLSHLGYKYENDKISDFVLAKKSRGIDIIIGGHTHTLLENPVNVRNRENENVVIAQVGWAGIRLGKIEIFTDKKSRAKKITAVTTPIISAG